MYTIRFRIELEIESCCEILQSTGLPLAMLPSMYGKQIFQCVHTDSARYSILFKIRLLPLVVLPSRLCTKLRDSTLIFIFLFNSDDYRHTIISKNDVLKFLIKNKIA